MLLVLITWEEVHLEDLRFGNTQYVAKVLSAFGAPAFGSSAAPINVNPPSTTSAFGAPSFGSTGFGAMADQSQANPLVKSPGSMGSAFGQPALSEQTANPSSSVISNSMSTPHLKAATNTPLTTTPLVHRNKNASQNASSTSSAFGKPTFGAATNTQSCHLVIIPKNISTSSGTGVSHFKPFGTNSNNKSPF
ncbi:ATV_HP_G0015070.mRNA.1.CDS.1 [Saccharomyces cerevisiae]|nr:ATV_HP_G0015070.mRNA.1.CDS.1 [Saccharomyces cerevisiae]CAI6950041.1 ATV_HP_G0015070.mRNA.1.CDS.1 [Saccharomyces cerevisiae]